MLLRKNARKRFSRAQYVLTELRSARPKLKLPTYTYVVVIKYGHVYNSAPRAVLLVVYTAANKSRFPDRVDNDDSINRSVYVWVRVSACVGLS